MFVHDKQHVHKLTDSYVHKRRLLSYIRVLLAVCYVFGKDWVI